MTRKETILRLAKGRFGRAKNCIKIALRRVEKGLQQAFKGRKLKKRIARAEFITSMNAGCRQHGITYSALVNGMNNASIGINRKIMSQLALEEPYSFRAVVEEAKGALRRVVLEGKHVVEQPPPSVLPDGDASSTVDRGIVDSYTGPPLPPYPRRIKQYS